MAFNEDTRVKIPTILHLCKLGYQYISLKNAKWDKDTNIFKDIFFESLSKINPDAELEELEKEFEDLSFVLDYDDLGKAFYQKLVTQTGIKLIDLSSPENFERNNSFHVVTELSCRNGDEEFRPDITLLINGMPLAFIEVKKPNNREGILAERNRINVRFSNKKFKKFINISQILVFTNNMEYDTESIVPIQGVFYSSTSYSRANFNPFREEETFDLTSLLKKIDDDLENFVLKDNNLTSIKHNPEFIENKSPSSPTNRVMTSLFSMERFAFLLKYSLAYVETEKGLEKHIMRYPQIFATKAISQTLDKKIKRGIVWHTQGSGKTALAYYNVHYLTDYLQQKQIIPKFYFIVDRIDLLNQAKREFSSRGLVVHTVSSREEFAEEFKNKSVTHNAAGDREITVVNIHKFKDDPDFLKKIDYDINVQRVYFLDEVHRSYNPHGSFLANLYNSDRNAILIGLTGTPLIGKDRSTRDTFGDYIHKYYYNASISDGYTLKLIREGIETNYQIQLDQALKEIEIMKGDADRRYIYSHTKFVEPMLDYIVEDFLKSRIRMGDNSIGGMVVCDSSDQAVEMSRIFAKKYSKSLNSYFETNNNYAYNSADDYVRNDDSLSGSLILHDSGNKDDRKQATENFKEGKIDLLFVYNMLLTGFDAKRLKKLYIGRVIKKHNLLQTLTRVNRPYKEFKYGFVVDFADIRQEFEATNKAYWDELQDELGDELTSYSNIFKSKEEIETEIEEIKDKLFQYDLDNAEKFSQQINEIHDREKLVDVKKALENAKNLYNLIRLFGHFDLLEKLDFRKLQTLYNEATRCLDMINLRESLEKNTDNTNLLNVALENIVFKFKKISEAEMIIAESLQDALKRTREELAGNIDKQDPEFISLYDELKRLFKQKKLDEVSTDEMKQNIKALEEIYRKVQELNRVNKNLQAKYDNDAKYVRLHKLIQRDNTINQKESAIFASLSKIKQKVDDQVLNNNQLIRNEGYFKKLLMPMVIQEFQSHAPLTPDGARSINNHIADEYLNEYQGGYAW